MEQHGMPLRLTKESKYVWAIAYIDRDYLSTVEKQLSKFPEYFDVQAYIPTVRILKKRFKNENHYEHIPLLFNYGFFRLPLRLINAESLADLKKNIQVIYSWVKDPINLFNEPPSLNRENKTIRRPIQMAVGTASDEEIARLINASHKLSIFDKEELEKIKPGDTILLRGFPWEGIPATVKHINIKKGEVRVEADLGSHIQDTILAFDHIFWSIYQGSYDENNHKKELSLEDLSIKKRAAANRNKSDE